MDGHRRLELEGLQVDLRSNVRDFADLHPTKLYGRPRSEPTYRLIEDELIRLRIARGRFERLRPSCIQRKQSVRFCDGKKLTGGRRLERDTANQDRQQRLGLHIEPV